MPYQHTLVGGGKLIHYLQLTGRYTAQEMKEVGGILLGNLPENGELVYIIIDVRNLASFETSLHEIQKANKDVFSNTQIGWLLVLKPESGLILDKIMDFVTAMVSQAMHGSTKTYSKPVDIIIHLGKEIPADKIPIYQSSLEALAKQFK